MICDRCDNDVDQVFKQPDGLVCIPCVVSDNKNG